MKYSVVILSGGKSTRMGTDKGSLLLNEKSFVDSLVNGMQGADEILLSVGEEDIYSAGIRHIHDEYKECGPMGGVHKAIKEAANDWVFAVACDMPLMDRAFADSLLDEGLKVKPEAKVILPMGKDGRLHMLGGFYHRSLFSLFEKKLESGERKMRSLLGETESIVLPVLDYENGIKLNNINTEEDYLELKDSIGSKTPVISFVGYSNSGKSTLIQSVIKELSQKGIKVAYLKHTHHEIDLSGKNKDNEKMYEAGALYSAVISDGKMQWLDRSGKEIQTIIEDVKGVDLIIIEGYKSMGYNKILVTIDNEEQNWPVKRDAVCKVVGPDNSPVYDYCRDDVTGICSYLESVLG